MKVDWIIQQTAT